MQERKDALGAHSRKIDQSRSNMSADIKKFISLDKIVNVLFESWGKSINIFRLFSIR